MNRDQVIFAGIIEALFKPNNHTMEVLYLVKEIGFDL